MGFMQRRTEEQELWSESHDLCCQGISHVWVFLLISHHEPVIVANRVINLGIEQYEEARD